MMNATKKNLSLGNAPLHSWDIFMYGYKRRMLLSGDLQHLKAIQNQYGWSMPPVEPGFELIWLNKVVIITNPALKIIYASENIYGMTGYRPHEVIGSTPSIFQGRETTEETRSIIRNAVAGHTRFETVIVNYKKNGSAYNCHVDGYPIFNKSGALVNFVALESAVA